MIETIQNQGESKVCEPVKMMGGTAPKKHRELMFQMVVRQTYQSFTFCDYRKKSCLGDEITHREAHYKLEKHVIRVCSTFDLSPLPSDTSISDVATISER